MHVCVCARVCVSKSFFLRRAAEGDAAREKAMEVLRRSAESAAETSMVEKKKELEQAEQHETMARMSLVQR